MRFHDALQRSTSDMTRRVALVYTRKRPHRASRMVSLAYQYNQEFHKTQAMESGIFSGMTRAAGDVEYILPAARAAAMPTVV
jgi:hypothetical protein